MADVDFESQIIFSLYKAPGNWHAVLLRGIKPDFFYDSDNGKIFSALKDYYIKYKKSPIPEHLNQFIKDSSGKAMDKWVDICLSSAQVPNLEYSLDELIKAYKIRLMQTGLEQSITSLESNDIDKSIDNVRKAIYRIEDSTAEEVSEGELRFSTEERSKSYDDIKNNAIPPGIPTGFPTFDECTGGMHGGELIIIAAKSSEGKSCFLLNVAHHVYRNLGKKVLYVSAEMAKSKLERRFDALFSKVSHHQLKNASLSKADEIRYREDLRLQSELPGVLYIFDIPDCTPSLIESTIARLETQYKFDLIIVDYLNILKSERRGEAWEEQGNIAKDVRKIARTRNIPLLTAVQINREGMKTKGEHYGQEHIALSQLIVNHSDVILSLRVAKPEMLLVSDICDINAWFIKNRDGARKSFKIIASFDQSKMEEPGGFVAQAIPDNAMESSPFEEMTA